MITVYIVRDELELGTYEDENLIEVMDTIYIDKKKNELEVCEDVNDSILVKNVSLNKGKHPLTYKESSLRKVIVIPYIDEKEKLKVELNKKSSRNIKERIVAFHDRIKEVLKAINNKIDFYDGCEDIYVFTHFGDGTLFKLYAIEDKLQQKYNKLQQEDLNWHFFVISEHHRIPSELFPDNRSFVIPIKDNFDRMLNNLSIRKKAEEETRVKEKSIIILKKFRIKCQSLEDIKNKEINLNDELKSLWSKCRRRAIITALLKKDKDSKFFIDFLHGNSEISLEIGKVEIFTNALSEVIKDLERHVK